MSEIVDLKSILVVDDDLELRDIIGFLVESHTGSKIHYASSGNQAIAFLKENHTSVKLVISDYNMGDGSGGKIFEYLVDAKLEIPFILCSTENPEQCPEFNLRPISGYAEKPNIKTPLLAALDRVLPHSDFQSSKGESDPVSEKKLTRVSLRLLKMANVLPCFVYIKISENKFIKVYQPTDVFADADMEKYKTKNVDFLYIEYADTANFFDKLLRGFCSNMEIAKIDSSGLPERFQISQDLAESMHDIATKLGYTEELRSLAATNINIALNILANNPGLSERLKNFNLNDGSYISAHSVLLATVSCWIATIMDWPSEQTFIKLTLAAFLHDIALSDNELAKVQEENEFAGQAVHFTKEGMDAWKRHPIDGASIASQFSEVPPDVDIIILQHHERPHGEGSPHGINHLRIAPLSSLFIVAHELVNSYRLQKDKFDMASFVEQAKLKFDIGSMKRILEKIATAKI